MAIRLNKQTTIVFGIALSVIVLVALIFYRIFTKNISEPVKRIDIYFSVNSPRYVNYFIGAEGHNGYFFVPIQFGDTVRKGFMDETVVVRGVLDPVKGCKGGTLMKESVVDGCLNHIFLCAREIIDGDFGPWEVYAIAPGDVINQIEIGKSGSDNALLGHMLVALKTAQKSYQSIRDKE